MSPGGALTVAALEALGRSLREIDPASLSADPEEGRARWLLGDSGTELFTWTHAGARVPHHVQLVFARCSVEWNAAEGLVTGELPRGAASSGGRYDPYLIEPHVGVDVPLCAAARTLLRASALEPADLGGLLGALETLTR